MPRSLEDVLEALDRIAPLRLAEPWDNTGLLLAPTAPRAVARALLAIDLTPAVLDEAERGRADLVIAYHPPIFDGLKRLVGGRPGEGTIVRALELGIAVYSPHTALDAAPGGLNDWIADGLGAGVRVPVKAASDAEPAAGQGREVVLERPASLATLVKRVKARLGIARVRVATAPEHRRPGAAIARIALCAGAGGMLLRGSRADLLVTGEMRHHDVLDATRRGASVILTDHTHSERGYLPVLAARLVAELGRGVRVAVSRADREPLDIV